MGRRIFSAAITCRYFILAGLVTTVTFTNALLNPIRQPVKPVDNEPVFPVIDPHGLLANTTDFTLNGTTLRILSGAIHYFRVPHQYWQDRLERLRGLGANTVETYVAWNLHEPSPGNVNFSGNLDIRRFLKTAQSLGLNVILRPGPYICAEWDFGGFPSWLLRDPDMVVRTPYAPFMKAVDSWFAKLLAEIGDLQYMSGGPIIAMQIENEYGGFGSDLVYLKSIGDLLIKHGATELLFTCDNDGGRAHGRIPGVLETLTGQQGMAASLADLRRLQPNMPLMVIEFWSGWFDQWNESAHHTWAVKPYLEQLNTILIANNASINFYMAHGGTNFGFMAGAGGGPAANNTWNYNSDVTSYDYDAPIGEDGTLHPTKYNATRQFLAQISHQPLPPMPAPPVLRAYGTISPNGYLPLYPEASPQHDKAGNTMLQFVTNRQDSSAILQMEMLNINNGAGQQYGYILYSRNMASMDDDLNDDSNTTLVITGGVRDRMTVVYGGIQQDTPYPKVLPIRQDEPVNISLPRRGTYKSTLNILVENRGRVNGQFREKVFELQNNQRKGLRGTVEFDGKALTDGWSIYPLEFNSEYMQALLDHKSAFTSPNNLSQQNFPAMLRYELTIESSDSVQDSFFFAPPNIIKGVAFVNGHNLGRFWQIGPQKSLYIPKWYLNEGQNSIMVFAEEANPEGRANALDIELRNKPDLGPTN